MDKLRGIATVKSSVKSSLRDSKKPTAKKAVRGLSEVKLPFVLEVYWGRLAKAHAPIPESFRPIWSWLPWVYCVDARTGFSEVPGGDTLLNISCKLKRL